MPAIAAHYQFGQRVLRNLDGNVQELIKNNKEMFDLGLQGPDLLFYYRPQNKNEISKLGHEIHNRSGKEFFGDIIRKEDVLKDSEKAYILGVCCHYSLDRNCHPLINKYAKTSIEHQILESEFDRFIIYKYQLSGKRYKMIPIKNIDVIGLEGIYREVNKIKIREANYTMRLANIFLQYKWVIEKFEGIISKPKIFSTLVLPKEVRQEERCYEIFKLFNKSILDAIKIIEILTKDDITDNELKEYMSLNFEGVFV